MKLNKQDNPKRQFKLLDDGNIKIDDQIFQRPSLITSDEIHPLEQHLLTSAGDLANLIKPAKLLLIGADNKDHLSLIESLKWPLEHHQIGSEIMPIVSAFQTFTILAEENRQFKMIII